MPVHLFPGMPSCGAGFAVNICLKELPIHPLLNVIVCSNAWHRWRRLQRLLSLVLETDFTVRGLLAVEPALVDQMVMMTAKHDQVVQTCFAAICPVFYVVSVDGSGVGTAGEATSFVSNA